MRAMDASMEPANELDETRAVLLDKAHGRFGTIPDALVVEHVLWATEGGDFAVREAALDAVLRRWRFAERDELAVTKSPEDGRVLGAYATARRSERGRRGGTREARPYSSELESLEPLRGNCGCLDYLRSGLGVCKHLLVVIDHVTRNAGRLARARHEQGKRPGRRARLVWDPRLPLGGALDRLRGLRLDGTSSLGALVQGLAAGRRREEAVRVLARATRGKRPRVEASAAALALLTEELERAERQRDHAIAARTAARELRGLRRKLYPYQREGVMRVLRDGRLLLADDMGLGKTTQAIAACHALFRTGRVRRGIVITPASLKGQWLREWQAITKVPATIVDGGPAQRRMQYRALTRGFLIMNYEQLLRDGAEVAKLAPDIVVIDEAQRIKNYATKSATSVKALEPAYRLALTGTPMENRLEELASLLDWIDDVALAPKWRLVPWYTRWEGDASHRGRAGARHLDTLRERIGPVVLRRVRQDVLRQLPPRTDTRVPVGMTEQQRGAHDDLDRPIAALVRTGQRRPLTQPEFLRLMQLLTRQRMISNGLGLLEFEALWPTYRHARPDGPLLEGLFAPKLAELRNLIADLVHAQGRKVVVFSQWRRMLRLAAWSVGDLLGEAGLGAVFFTGAERPAQRTRSIVDFHDDPRVRLMFLTDAGGVGLNLQRAANACIYLEMPWNPAVLEQRIGRIYRLGQKQPIDVYNLVSEHGIESRIAGLVGAKQALFSGLFDGTSDEIRFDTAASFLTRVERMLEPAILAAEDPAAREDDDDATSVVKSGDRERPNGDAAATTAAFDAGAPALLSALRIERTAAGGLRIEAPPEAAATLAAMFESMAKLMHAASTVR
jgi:superfamily II DNA or RNA helicase